MKRIIVLIVLTGLWNSLQAQKIVKPLPTDVLARVGSTVITARDLIERIELMPWPEKEKAKRHDSSKVKALNSLVAERLLAIEGKLRNVGSDDISKGKLRTMEKLFVRDELYKREVKQKITVSQSEIRDGLAKFAWQLHLVAVAVKDEAAGDSLYHLLQRNSALTSALEKYPPHFVAAMETVQVNFGGLDTVFENNAYAIGNNKFSKPFFCPTYGWVVACLQDRGTNPVAEKMSAGDRHYRVDEMIRNKKEAPLGSRFIASVLVPQKANVDSVLFERLAGALHAVLSRDSLQRRKNGMYALSSDDVDELETILKNDTRKPFVQMKGTPLSLGEAIEGLRHLRFGFPTLDLKKFKGTLNGHMRFVVETELLAREGYRQQLQYAEPVKRDVNMWANYWASRYLMWNVNDTVHVSDDEMLSALGAAAPQMGRSYEVNIQEVLCADLAEASRVLTEYSHGTSLAQLVETYSRREEWKSRHGISGYMALTTHPELTQRAFLSDTGAIAGPIRVGSGYSVFKVLGKRKTGVGNDPAVDTAIANIRNNLTSEKRRRAMNTYVTGLAKKYTVDISYEKLPSIIIQPANMYTRRNIGFGGMVTAAPLLYPNWEWVKEYRDGGNVIP